MRFGVGVYGRNEWNMGNRGSFRKLIFILLFRGYGVKDLVLEFIFLETNRNLVEI